MNQTTANFARILARIDRLRRTVLRAGEQASATQQQLSEAEAELRSIRNQVRVPATLLAADAHAKGGDQAGAETTGLKVTVRRRLAAVPTGIAHLLRETLLQVEVKYVKGQKKYARVRVQVELLGYSALCVATREIEKGKSMEIDLLPTLFPQAIREIRELTRASLRVTVEDLDTQLIEIDETSTIDLLARTSAYTYIQDPETNEWKDMSQYMAAWVTPNDPAVMACLRRCAERVPNKQIVGYQVGPTGVEAQVQAMFETLHTDGIVYVNSVLASGNTAAQYYQRVRMPAESLADRAANCIDGTVLMASLLEAASLEAGIVFLSDHAFLAWRTKDVTEDESAPWAFLETTMIQGGDFAKAKAAGAKTEKQYRLEAAELPADEAAFHYNLVSVQKLREAGILPMG